MARQAYRGTGRHSDSISSFYYCSLYCFLSSSNSLQEEERGEKTWKSLSSTLLSPPPTSPRFVSTFLSVALCFSVTDPARLISNLNMSVWLQNRPGHPSPLSSSSFPSPNRPHFQSRGMMSCRCLERRGGSGVGVCVCVCVCAPVGGGQPWDKGSWEWEVM